MTGRVVILGVFVADTAFRAARLPRIGETILGQGFALGPGGKGSNQAVAVGRLGQPVSFITRVGDDPFGEMALKVWGEAGVTPVVTRASGSQTGAAFIFVDAASGDNAIIISPGAAAEIAPADLEAQAALIAASAVFLTQLEQPLAAAVRGLELARAAGVTTILNPAPAQDLADAVLGLCDWITPNETEAAAITGLPVGSDAEARAAADRLIARGAGGVVMTLGARGALLHGRGRSEVVPAIPAPRVVETTGAGDAFNGGFATGLARGLDPADAVRLGCVVAGLSVTRAGAAASMPTADEVAAALGAAR
jgi:ribokinase